MNINEAFQYYSLLEQQFWKKLSVETIQHITFQGNLTPIDMLLYGEFGFLLLGLKPAMLIDFCDAKINHLYFETVVQPVIYALKTETAITLDCHIVNDNLRTPEASLNGCIFVYHRQKRDLLASILTTTQKDTVIPEKMMATILDYPGSLPANEKEIPTMLSVIYLHERPGKGTVAVTTFAIQQFERKATIEHFEQYKAICKREFDMELKLLVQ